MYVYMYLFLFFDCIHSNQLRCAAGPHVWGDVSEWKGGRAGANAGRAGANPGDGCSDLCTTLFYHAPPITYTICVGTLFVIKMSSKFVFDRTANLLKTVCNNFRVTKSIINSKQSNSSAKKIIFKYFAQLPVKPVEIK